MLDQSRLDNFGRLFFNRFGIALTAEEAEAQSQALLELMKIVYRPVPKVTQVKVGQHELTAA